MLVAAAVDVVVVVVAVVVIAGGGVAFYMMRSQNTPNTVPAKLEEKELSPGVAVDMENPPPGAPSTCALCFINHGYT